MASDIKLFMVTTNRSENHKNNAIRENVLKILHDPPEKYINDPIYGNMWNTISKKWKTFLSTLCGLTYDDIRINKKAGRRYNYDYEILFLNEGLVVKVIKAEFKHNAVSIDKIPQYFNAPEKKRYIEKCYAEYFYDNYIDRICSLSETLVKPSKNIYMENIYSNTSTIKFFVKLKEIENKISNEKKRIVCESIKNYLELYSETLDLNTLSTDIKKTQSGKIFILWDCENFRKDEFLEDEFDIKNIVCVKNDNVIVVRSKYGTIHNLLLRWKNRLGILYPAWQISLQR